jgi:hypothetical protein
VWPVPLDPTGRTGPTPGQARGPRWRRSSHGLYVPADIERTVDQRIAEAAAVLPAFGGVTGWAALHWQGAFWFDGLTHGGAAERPVTLVPADSSIRAQAGIAISEERLDPRELVVHRGLTITIPVRSVWFEMRYSASDTAAVQFADMAAYDDLVSRSELEAWAVNRGWTGSQRFRDGVLDMEENAWSPTEVTMRQFWTHLGGFPRPACNRPVFDLAGRHLVTPDLIDDAAGVAGEYDGAVHLEGAQRARDVHREAIYRDVGLELVVMLAGDLREPYGFLGRLRQAYQRAARRPSTDRRWTSELPPWWVPTFTVEQRRCLDDEQRRRLLGFRQRAS